MSDVVVDSSVVAKWVLPESDSAQAHRLITQTADSGGRLIVLDLAFPEVANAIWKRQRQRLVTPDEALSFLGALARIPVHIEPAVRLLDAAYAIARRYDRSVYDALFVALAKERGVEGVTADEPLVNSVGRDFPQVVLLRNLKLK